MPPRNTDPGEAIYRALEQVQGALNEQARLGERLASNTAQVERMQAHLDNVAERLTEATVNLTKVAGSLTRVEQADRHFEERLKEVATAQKKSDERVEKLAVEASELRGKMLPVFTACAAAAGAAGAAVVKFIGG